MAPQAHRLEPRSEGLPRDGSRLETRVTVLSGAPLALCRGRPVDAARRMVRAGADVRASHIPSPRPRAGVHGSASASARALLRGLAARWAPAQGRGDGFEPRRTPCRGRPVDSARRTVRAGADVMVPHIPSPRPRAGVHGAASAPARASLRVLVARWAPAQGRGDGFESRPAPCRGRPVDAARGTARAGADVTAPHIPSPRPRAGAHGAASAPALASLRALAARWAPAQGRGDGAV